MTLTRAVPSSGCSQLCQMHSDAIIGSATEQAAAARDTAQELAGRPPARAAAGLQRFEDQYVGE